jgi:hypothetical protein
VIHVRQVGEARLLVMGGLLMLGVLAATGYWLMGRDSYEFPVSRQVHWHLVVRNQSDQALHDVELFSFMPHGRTWQQSLIEVDANYPVSADQSDLSQPVGRMVLPTIPPYGQREVRISAELHMADHHANRDAVVPERLLLPEALIESDHQTVIELASRLQRVDADQTARAIFDWLVAEINYSGYDPIDRGALYAIEQRQGDCTEYAALAVALARALGLPARLVNGYVVAESGRLDPFGFHAWAEVRMADRWLILDAQKRRFDASPENYLSTHYGTSASRAAAWTRFHSPESSVVIEMR